MSLRSTELSLPQFISPLSLIFLSKDNWYSPVFLSISIYDIHLFDCYAYPEGIDRTLDENLFLFISTDHHRGK